MRIRGSLEGRFCYPDRADSIEKGGQVAVQESVLALQERLANEQRLVHLIDRIHSAKTLDSIFIEVQGEILTFFDADRMTLYAVDRSARRSTPSSWPSTRSRRSGVPISAKSVAGFVALSQADREHRGRLRRQPSSSASRPSCTSTASFDKRTGFRTTQILCMPILHEGKVLGVVQILNKKQGPRFTKDDEASVARIAKTLGIAFNNQAQLGAQRRGTKFDYLIAQGMVSQDEVNQAIGVARQKNLDVETVLLEQFRVPKAELGASLSQFYRVPFVEFDAKIIPPPDLMKDLKLEFLKRNLWLPIRREDNAIVVLIDNPQDLQRVDAIHQLLRGQQIKLAVGLRKDINTFLARPAASCSRKDNIGNILSDLGAEAPLEKEDVGGGDIDENDSAVIRLANQIIIDAFKARASDIHVEPYGAAEGHDDPAAHRRPVPRVPAHPRRLPARPGRAAQDHGPARHRRAPQAAGRQDQVPRCPTGATSSSAWRRCRPQGGNEDVVMRLLAASEPIPIDKLGMTRAQPARDPGRGREAVRAHPGGGPDRLRQDDHAALGARRTSTGPSGRSGPPRTRSRSRSTGCARCRCSRRSASRSRRRCARSCAPTPTSSWSVRCATRRRPPPASRPR